VGAKLSYRFQQIIVGNYMLFFLYAYGLYAYRAYFLVKNQAHAKHNANLNLPYELNLFLRN